MPQKYKRAQAPGYRNWEAMMTRCYKQNHVAYDKYGGAGILVCERWKDFDLFLEDMGPPPSREHTLDRIDNDKGYEPGNVRWATRKEQQNNRKCNHIIEINGERRTMAQWAEHHGISPETVLSRIKAGYAVEDLFIPPHSRKEVYFVEWEGERLPIAEVSKRTGCPVGRLRTRLKAGWSAADAVLKPPVNRSRHYSYEVETKTLCG